MVMTGAYQKPAGPGVAFWAPALPVCLSRL